jgi:hypothetical protein
MTQTAASSDETLVDPLHFVLSHDNPTHTVIRGPGRRNLYQIVSNNSNNDNSSSGGGGENTTVITKFGIGWNGESISQEVATIYWSKMGFHRVRLNGQGKAVKISKVLHSGPLFSE